MKKELPVLPETASTKDALRLINELAQPGLTIFITNTEGAVVGSVTDGDIRRGLLNDLPLSEPVSRFMHTGFRFVTEGLVDRHKLREFREKNFRFIPVLDADKKLVRVIDLHKTKAQLPVDALLMAGGRGERLRPLTDTLPKPLLKIGTKPIIRHNTDRLASYGIDNITISLRYLSDSIRDEYRNDTSIRFVEEQDALGTAGALSLLGPLQNDTVLLMNSDLLTDLDYAEFFETFTASNADLCVATIPYRVNVPYAVMEIGENGNVEGFTEKPEYIHYSNAGIYLMKSSILQEVPKNTKFDATDLMELLITQGRVVRNYPILSYWLDIGRPDDYRKAQEDIVHLKF